MDATLSTLEDAVNAAGLALVYNADDWKLLGDANITPDVNSILPPASH